MAWDFETEPEFQEKLDWVETFVRQEIEPLDLVLGNPYDKSDTKALDIVRPLQEQVRQRGLWAAHLGPELGGQGYGQLKLALLNGEISSAYSMTEPHAGADPTLFKTRAELDGSEWVINGEKWFSSNARYASFLIVMAVTNSEVSAYQGMSMFIVPAETPGVNIVRNVGIGTEPEGEGSHAYIRYENVRVPQDHLLGEEGGAFGIAQTRLGGGRIHHGMRTVGQCRRAFDMMCERAVSRQTRDDSWIELEQFRLLVLRTAWLIDRYQDYRRVRKDIAAVKATMPKVLSNIAQRALHLHGALGVSNEMPFVGMLIGAESLALADGPTEVHKVTVARQVLREYKPADGLWPRAHLPTRRAEARARFAELLEHEVANS
jgi:acyl-CoA dehydrogenase